MSAFRHPNIIIVTTIIPGNEAARKIPNDGTARNKTSQIMGKKEKEKEKRQTETKTDRHEEMYSYACMYVSLMAITGQTILTIILVSLSPISPLPSTRHGIKEAKRERGHLLMIHVAS